MAPGEGKNGNFIRRFSTYVGGRFSERFNQRRTREFDRETSDDGGLGRGRVG